MQLVSFNDWMQNGSGRIRDGVWEYTPQTSQPSDVTLSKKGLKPGKFKLVVLSQGGSIRIDYTLWGEEDTLKIDGFRNFNPTLGSDKEEEFETEIDDYRCDKLDMVITIEVYATGSTGKVSLYASDDDNDDDNGGGDDSGEAESVDKLRIGARRPDALMLAKPYIEHTYEFDFLTDWIVNPDQTAGVTVEAGRIVVSKVKPNTWFIRSNYGLSTDAARNEKFLGKLFTLSGISAIAGAGLISGVAVNSYTAWGLVISPCNDGGGFFSESYPWEMNIAGGSFKYGPQGALNYGYTVDGERALYNYAVPNTRPNTWDGGCYEVGFALYTGATPGADGFLELPVPLVIEAADDSAFDPASREGWKAAYGRILVYEKIKTFRNCLMRYDLAFEEKDSYTTPVQGATVTIDPEGEPGGVAYVATERAYADQYPKVRFPVPADFADLIAQSWPFKLWCKQVDVPGKPSFWAAVVRAFKDTDIVSPTFTDHLFTLSNVKGAALADGDGFVELRLNCPNEDPVYRFFSLDGAFDWSEADRVRIRVLRGYTTSIKNMFRQTRSLLAVEFVNEDGTVPLSCCASEWSGAFEYSALPEFPAGLGAFGRNKGCSELTCNIPYAFHGAVMPVIGNLNPDGGGNPADETFINSFEGWATKYNANVSGASFSTANGYIGVTMLRVGMMQVRVSGLVAASVATAYVKATGTNSAGETLQQLMYAEQDGTYMFTFYPGYLQIDLWNGTRGDATVEIVTSQYFGAAPSVDGRYTMLVSPFCEYAFDGWTGHTVLYDLDFKFVNPAENADNVLNCPGLTTARIAGLNKGTWCLDGVSRGGHVHGNLPNLDADSVDYLLRNLFDLRQNAGGDAAKTEITPGLSSAALYLPAELQAKATSGALAEASARGWTVTFGG